MKKILFFIIVIILLVNCKKEKDMPPCSLGPIEMQFELTIEKDNPRIKDFTLDAKGELKQEEVYFYKIINEKQKKLLYHGEVHRRNDTINSIEFSFGNLREDFFTGKLETIYFKTPIRVDTIKIMGDVMPSKGCGEYLFYKYFSVNNNEEQKKLPFEIK